MKLWAELEAPADPKDRKAGTVRESLEALHRAGMPRDGRLDSWKLPTGFEYLWQLFWDVRSGASQGMDGIKLSWRDLADYSSVTGISLDAFEVEAIMALDNQLRATKAEGAK